MWESKYNYRMKGVVGKVVFTERTNVYMLKDRLGYLYPVPHEKGETIRAGENLRMARGRPALFEDKPASSKSITLPEEYWAAMKEPYSMSIAEAVKRVYIDGKD